MSSGLAIDMGKRVGLKAATSAKIYLNVKQWHIQRGLALNIVLLAQAIKYVADNKQHLREVWK